MKKGIHPKVNMATVVTCACGNKFTTISTLPTISVEICNACHPFYTGQRRFVDTERRIDKFNKKFQLAEEKKQQAEAAKKAKQAKKQKGSSAKVQDLKELLKQAEASTKATAETQDQ